jgi:hypothetical protein
LDSVAGEDLDAPIIPAHGEVDRQLALAMSKTGVNGGIELEPPGGAFELAQRHRPGVGHTARKIGRATFGS